MSKQLATMPLGRLLTDGIVARTLVAELEFQVR